MAVVCGLAIYRGNMATRWAGVSVALGWLVTSLSEQYVDIGSPLYVGIAVDILILAVFGVLSYFTVSHWPVVATVFQALGMAVHVSYLFEVQIGVWLYYSGLIVSAFGVLGSVGFGTWLAWRERVAEAMSAPVPTRSA